MIYARKPKFCWLSAGPYILAGCLFIGLVGSGLPGIFGTIFASIALIPLAMLGLAVVGALAMTLLRFIR